MFAFLLSTSCLVHFASPSQCVVLVSAFGVFWFGVLVAGFHSFHSFLNQLLVPCQWELCLVNLFCSSFFTLAVSLFGLCLPVSGFLLVVFS